MSRSDKALLSLSKLLSDLGESLALEIEGGMDKYMETLDDADLELVKTRFLTQINSLKEMTIKSRLNTQLDELLENAAASNLQANVQINHMNLPVNKWIAQDVSGIPLPTQFLDEDVNVRSPIIQHLLENWSADANKVLYVTNWVESLKETTLPEHFPIGLQIVQLTAVLKEGFLLLLIPVILKLSLHPLIVYIRRRLKEDSQQLGGIENSYNYVYDIRIKVNVEQTNSTNNEAIRRDSGGGLDNLWNGLGSSVDNIMQTPIAQNLVSFFSPSTTPPRNTMETDTGNSHVPSDGNPGTPGTTIDRSLIEGTTENEERRKKDREWSNEVHHLEKVRTNSLDGGNLEVGDLDQSPHRALRGSEAALQLGGFQSELPMPPKEEGEENNGTTKPTSKLSLVQAKLTKLREAKEKK